MLPVRETLFHVMSLPKIENGSKNYSGGCGDKVGIMVGSGWAEGKKHGC